jgi:hypothetical protein
VLAAAALSDGPPASGAGESSSSLPLDPELLDSNRLEEDAGASMGHLLSPSSDASDSGDDADLRRLKENLSRPCPIFWNGRDITYAWLAGCSVPRAMSTWSLLSGQAERGRWLAKFLEAVLGREDRKHAIAGGWGWQSGKRLGAELVPFLSDWLAQCGDGRHN